ncbi:class III chitin synthase [Phakopsora pachyrhizi]|uniref:Chitin synthase n=1 Tax=Phakopsora pachyrhizi TaxID=170000 RepID=A0AAV0BN73_PHAPC|nr:class III chitin synthase [Phakopsora pachyrhizi]CAH7688751.1 class III chitin synthase [Phakopsora pachyrhizi]
MSDPFKSAPRYQSSDSPPHLGHFSSPLSPGDGLGNNFSNESPQHSSPEGSEQYELSDSAIKYDSLDPTFNPELDDEAIPLNSRTHVLGTRPAGFLHDQQNDKSYTTEDDPTTTFGFPVPSFSDGFDSRPNNESIANRSSLYRSQTTAEAWHRRQKIDPKRAKTIKVKLKQGNFVNEYPVPTAVKNGNLAGGYKGEATEFSHMRYSAVTCDPDDFTREAGWTLRTENYNRKTELLVAFTYYNEDKILVARTLHGVMMNLRDMCKAKWSEFRRLSSRGDAEAGSTDAWKMISVVLVFDGIEPADKATLDVLATIGLYQDGVMKRDVDGKETQAHLFEYTTLLSVSPKPELIQPHPNDPANLVPVQMTLVLKQKNAKKINSHRWLFNAICPHLDPEVCILIDAGTKPGSRSLYYLWEAFHHNPNLGGACGEIHAMLSRGKKLINPLVAAQNFEYKVYILDKPLESSFGYVSVLPGAFSAYRYRAITGRPLQQYFHGDHSLSARLGKKGIQGMGIFKKNMFLAEDRILCFELVAKAKEKWVLGYVKPAKGETDVPESAPELIGQRRRWLNGSFAAGIYSLAHFGRMYRSSHNPIRMLFLHVQAAYTLAGLILSWFALGSWFITFAAIIDISKPRVGITDYNMQQPSNNATNSEESQRLVSWKIKECWSGTAFDDTAHLKDSSVDSKFDYLYWINWVFKLIYIFLVALQVIMALGNRPKGEKAAYVISFIIFGLFAAYLLSMTMILTIKAFCPLAEQINAAHGGNAFGVLLGSTYGPIMAGILGTFGLYIASSIIYLDPWHILHSFIPFLLISVSFTNILNVYAFCNLHDVSWGTKGSDQADSLPSVSSKKTSREGVKIVEDIHRSQKDLDAQFQQTVMRAIQPFRGGSEDEKPTEDDQNKTFRTRFVCFWLGMNSVLVIILLSSSQDVRTKFFEFLLWSNFFLGCVKFSGFLYYMFGETFFRIARLCSRLCHR